MHKTEASRPRARGVGKRILIGVGLFVLLVLLGGGGWVGANLLLRAPEPKPLWTEADFPKPPADGDNGWSTFVHGSKSLARPVISSSLTSICDPKGGGNAKDAWRDAKRQRVDIGDAVRDTSCRAWIELMARAYAKPSFADACPIDLEMPCPWLDFYRAHQVAELALLQRGLQGSWQEAFQRAVFLVEGDFAFIVSARSLLSQMVGFANAGRTLALTDVLLVGYEEAAADPERGDVDRATLGALRRALSKVRRDQLGMQRSVKGEYIFHARALDVIESEPARAGVAKGWGATGALGFDRGATMRILNDDFEAVMRFADKPGSTPPERPPLTEGSFWWLRNPVGKLALDMSQVALVPRLQEGAKRADELIARRDAIDKRIESMMKP